MRSEAEVRRRLNELAASGVEINACATDDGATRERHDAELAIAKAIRVAGFRGVISAIAEGIDTIRELQGDAVQLGAGELATMTDLAEALRASLALTDSIVAVARDSERWP